MEIYTFQIIDGQGNKQLFIGKDLSALRKDVWTAISKLIIPGSNITIAFKE